jgi:hypothetical protein
MYAGQLVFAQLMEHLPWHTLRRMGAVRAGYDGQLVQAAAEGSRHRRPWPEPAERCGVGGAEVGVRRGGVRTRNGKPPSKEGPGWGSARIYSNL